MNNPVSLRLAGICGMTAAVVPLASIFIAIGISPWFTWTGSWLSDLGRSTVPSASVFNNGLMAAGALGVIFSLGVRKAKEFGRVESDMGLATLLLTTIFLFMVGLFPVDADMPHTLASFLFFVFSIVTLLVLGNVLWKSGSSYGLFVLFLGILSACTFPLFFVPRPWGMNAVIEMVSSLSMSVFILSYSIRILFSGRKSYS
jgi:hypothetical membrane protein